METFSMTSANSMRHTGNKRDILVFAKTRGRASCPERPRMAVIPRMNRTPKPKSVYRDSARAPGREKLFE